MCMMLCLLQKLQLINFNQIQNGVICLALVVTKCALKIMTCISILIVQMLQRRQYQGNTIKLFVMFCLFLYTF
jgi:hypothetical protein